MEPAKIYIVNKPFNTEQLEKIESFKREFKIFFEGFRLTNFGPIIDIPIYKFGINGLDFSFTTDTDNFPVLVVSIKLSRPGILIGKGGQVIEELLGYLNAQVGKVKIELFESDLFASIENVTDLEYNFSVFIDGRLHHKAKDVNDAIWNLGAKFGALKYNDMYKNGQIKINTNQIFVKTKL
jgi:hypothetical protein